MTQLVSVLIITSMIHTGCDDMKFKGNTPDVKAPPKQQWPFCPRSVRIHPFTTFEKNDEDLWQLKIHLELLDLQGDPSKGLGQLQIELYELKQNQPNPVFDKKLEHVNIDLSDSTKSQNYYDRITRTYLYSLTVDPIPAPNKRLQLSVQFTDIYENKMINKMIIQSPAN